MSRAVEAAEYDRKKKKPSSRTPNVVIYSVNCITSYGFVKSDFRLSVNSFGLEHGDAAGVPA